MTLEAIPGSGGEFVPDWAEVFNASLAYVHRQFPLLADDAEDIAQEVTIRTREKNDAGKLILDHGRASLLAYAQTATRHTCINRLRPFGRRRNEVLEADHPFREHLFSEVEVRLVLRHVEHLPIECPLCLAHNAPCDDGSTVRDVARAACRHLVETGDRQALGPGRVDAFLRRAGAETGVLAPSAVDKSTSAGTSFTRRLAICTAHVVFQTLRPYKALPMIVLAPIVREFG